MTRNIDQMIELTQKPFRFAFDEVHFAGGYPRIVTLDPGEARILMWFYLKQSYLIYLKAEHGLLSFDSQESWLFAHARRRLADLIAADLISQALIDDWLSSRPIPIDFDKLEIPPDTLGLGEYGEIDVSDDCKNGTFEPDENNTSRNIDELVEQTRQSVIFPFDDFHCAEGFRKFTILYPGEAEILAEYYLRQRWIVEMQTQVFSYEKWDDWMSARVEWRLPELIDTGLIHQELIDAWTKAHPVPDLTAELEELEADAKHGADVSSNAEGEPKEEESLCTETDEVPF